MQQGLLINIESTIISSTSLSRVQGQTLCQTLEIQRRVEPCPYTLESQPSRLSRAKCPNLSVDFFSSSNYMRKKEEVTIMIKILF